MILVPNMECRCCCSAHEALTALMMLVWPEPGIQPVTTITMSPDLKNPRAFPDEDSEPELDLCYGPPRGESGNQSEALTDIHAKVDSAVHVVGPDGSGQRVEEDGEHPPQELGLTGHLRKTTEEENGTGTVYLKKKIKKKKL